MLSDKAGEPLGLTPDDIRDWVIAAQVGREDAFARLTEHHYAMVHGIALGATADWAAAEDLAQDVFVLAWRNLGSLSHPRAFSVWLRNIARNAATNWIRHQQFRRRTQERADAAMEHAAVVPIDPAATAARKELTARLKQGLQALSPKLREAIVVYYLEGKTVAEGAEALGIMPDAMKKRLKLGREQLLRHYQAAGEGTLEQLLPYSPTPQVSRVMAGLAAGPILFAGDGWSRPSPRRLVLDHLRHGGSVRSLREAGLGFRVLYVPLIASIAVIVLAFTAGVAMFSAQSRTPDEPTYVGIGAFTTDEWNHPHHGDHILVREVFAGYAASAAGIQPGDRVVAVEGVLVSEAGHPDKTHWLHGAEGETMEVGVIRAADDGHETSLTLRVGFSPVPTKLLDDARARHSSSVSMP